MSTKRVAVDAVQALHVKVTNYLVDNFPTATNHHEIMEVFDRLLDPPPDDLMYALKEGTEIRVIYTTSKNVSLYVLAEGGRVHPLGIPLVPKK